MVTYVSYSACVRQSAHFPLEMRDIQDLSRVLSVEGKDNNTQGALKEGRNFSESTRGSTKVNWACRRPCVLACFELRTQQEFRLSKCTNGLKFGAKVIAYESCLTSYACMFRIRGYASIKDWKRPVALKSIWIWVQLR